MKRWVVALAVLALTATGCSWQAGGDQPAVSPAQPPAPAAARPGLTDGAVMPAEPAEARAEPVEDSPSGVRLVPLDGKWELGWRMPVPEGWHVNVTMLKDNVQISRGDVLIMVSTRQLRNQAPPVTVDEMRGFIAPWAPPGTEISQTRHRGATSAFELRHPVQGDGPPTTDLSVYLFGSTYSQIVSLTAPTAALSQWEPMFREILTEFVPVNLDAEPLPGRP